MHKNGTFPGNYVDFPCLGIRRISLGKVKKFIGFLEGNFRVSLVLIFCFQSYVPTLFYILVLNHKYWLSITYHTYKAMDLDFWSLFKRFTVRSTSPKLSCMNYYELLIFHIFSSTAIIYPRWSVSAILIRLSVLMSSKVYVGTVSYRFACYLCS